MKNWLLILSICTLAFTGCDVIENPIKNGVFNEPGDSTLVLRKVVIEDFTGHQCKNCPKAAKQIKDIQALYGEQVIGIAIHAGPSNFTGINADYPTDFRTPEGTAIYNFFNIPALPMGMVSRIGYPSNTHLKTYSGWPAETANLIDSVARIKIEQNIGYSASDRNVTVTLTATALSDYADDLKVCVMLLESGIVSPQLMPDDTRDPDYVHNHVLRTMFTQALGDELGFSPIQINQEFNKQVSGTLDTEWDENECTVVTFIYNARTYEILQAEETAVIP